MRDLPLSPPSSNDELVITFDELKQWAANGNLLRHLFRYREATLQTYKAKAMMLPFLTAILLRLVSRGKCHIVDRYGHNQTVTILGLTRLFSQFVIDLTLRKNAVSRIHKDISGILDKKAQRPILSSAKLTHGRPAYLRTDLWFGVSSGGSVGHIAGVLNNLDKITGKPVFLTSDSIPTVRNDIETSIIDPEHRFWDFLEIPSLFYNTKFYEESRKILDNKKLSFIYQRYSLNNYTGVKLAKHYGVPFVLEYNGSEIWVSRNWGKHLKYEALSERIEMMNFKAAHLITVVSQPLKDELVARGVAPDKILVNPNGVNADKYSPAVDGSAIRAKLKSDDKQVIGFIGTFGKWHGAEVLAEAFGRLLQKYPVYRKTVLLLLIGDGVTMPLVKEALAKHGVNDACFLTGRIPQEDGPAHLAACDILASPHVPNSDGTPFFGSPTKLFEYMAMGKGIVASDLDQIGEILEHDITAWMVKPGDPDTLMLGLKRLIDDKGLRDRLGRAARDEVVANYTWKEHTRKIIEKLKAVLS